MPQTAESIPIESECADKQMVAVAAHCLCADTGPTQRTLVRLERACLNIKSDQKCFKLLGSK
jgi:hypothetical protein